MHWQDDNEVVRLTAPLPEEVLEYVFFLGLLDNIVHVDDVLEQRPEGDKYEDCEHLSPNDDFGDCAHQ